MRGLEHDHDFGLGLRRNAGQEQDGLVEILRQPAMVLRLVGVRVKALVRLGYHRHKARTKHHHHQPQQESLPGEVRDVLAELGQHGLRREHKKRRGHCKSHVRNPGLVRRHF